MTRRLTLAAFLAGLLLLVLPDIIVFYLIMPVPTSQQEDQMELAYALHGLLWYTRLLGLMLIVASLFQFIKTKKTSIIVWRSIAGAMGLLVVYLLGFHFMPENIFREPEQKIFAVAADNTVPDNNYIIGVELNGVAKAYPLKIVGYHHKIQDSIGTQSLLVTYCTMCRTGMVFDPIIEGKYQKFRLVGVAYKNAILEDGDTKSWWYQSTGIAGAGPLKGMTMKVIPYQQMTLAAWKQLYPNTMIMQPDPKFMTEYAKLKNYDLNIPTANTDSAKNKSFLPNSWVVGLVVDESSKAFLWNDLTKKRVINDFVDNIPVVIALEQDGYSFHSWKRTIADTVLNFTRDSDSLLRDAETNSHWNWRGECVDGILAGKKLTPVTAYQTYYHSWDRFYGKKHGKAIYSIHHDTSF
ncbi:MAG: DUF3179 domain-containing protein [Chitinophagales bacterium]|nr:DUF3179 domain-containing protein [Chitinophagales bacterium]